MSRVTHTRILAVVAECQSCDWKADDAGALGRAAQHHDRTDHETHIRQELLVVYGDGPTPEELGQTTLDDIGESGDTVGA